MYILEESNSNFRHVRLCNIDIHREKYFHREKWLNFLQTMDFAASYLGLHCLPITLLRYGRQNWVKRDLVWQCKRNTTVIWIVTKRADRTYTATEFSLEYIWRIFLHKCKTSRLNHLIYYITTKYRPIRIELNTVAWKPTFRVYTDSREPDQLAHSDTQNRVFNAYRCIAYWIL